MYPQLSVHLNHLNTINILSLTCILLEQMYVCSIRVNVYVIMDPNKQDSIITICDPVCEKGSYSLSKLSSLTNHNSSCFHPITIIVHQSIVLCQGYEGNKLQGDTTFTSQVTGCQVHAIEKAIRPLFTYRVTFCLTLLRSNGVQIPTLALALLSTAPL